MNYADLVLNGYGQTLSGLANLNSSTSVPSAVNLLSGASGTYADQVVNGSSTAVTLTIANAGNNSFSGVLGGKGSYENNFGLTKGGAGTLTLSGAGRLRANTYSGGTTLSAGQITLGASSTGYELRHQRSAGHGTR